MGSVYVDATLGLDTNDGSEAHPWQTVSKVNGATFAPGDCIYFKRGQTWVEILVPPISGTLDNWLTFGAYGEGALPVIDGGEARDFCINASGRTYLKFNNLKTYRPLLSGLQASAYSADGVIEANDCIFDASGDQNVQCDQGGNGHELDVRLSRCTISNAADDGVSIHYSPTVTIRECTFTGNSQGINDTASTGAQVNLLESLFEGHTHDNVYMTGGGRIVAKRCKFFHAGESAHGFIATDAEIDSSVFDVSGYSGVTAGLVRVDAAGGVIDVNNCTMYGGASKYGYVVVGAGAVTNLRNCVFYKVWNVGYIGAGGALNADYCIFNQVTSKTLTTNTNELTTDPALVDPANGDFHLQIGSPARNSGILIPGLTKDFDGLDVPQDALPCRGAFEYPIPRVAGMGRYGIGILRAVRGL